MRNQKLNVIDLFSGCGGLSLGFLQAGYKIIAGIDNDKSALNTFEKNHKGALALNMDLSDPDFCSNLENKVKDDIDIIVGGPPCQGFSLTGPRNFDDKRNQLYLAMINAVNHFSPQAFILENVMGLATLYDGKIKDEIVQRFEEIGYSVSYKILLAADFGVPQKRKRLFFVGLKEEFGKFEFPEPLFSVENYITCGDAISDLPPREGEIGPDVDEYPSRALTDYQEKMREGSKALYNHRGTNHTQKVIDVIKQVPEGGNHRDLPEGVGESRKFNEAWTRYHSKEPSKTIDTGHRNHFHYKFNRVPTIRENARLQSFPDSFRFYGTKTSQNRQVGNAVPPLLAKVLAEKLRNFLFKEEDLKERELQSQ